jgi:hypothetical protein
MQRILKGKRAARLELSIAPSLTSVKLICGNLRYLKRSRDSFQFGEPDAASEVDRELAGGKSEGETKWPVINRNR